MMKRMLTAAALAAVLAAPAFAAPPMSNTGTGANSSMDKSPNSSMDKSSNSSMDKGSTNTAAQPGFLQQQDANDWRSSKLVGASVYGPDNSSIGEIDDVLIAQNGQIHAVVVGVGGFLGVGQKDVALPFAALTITRKPDSDAIDKIKVSYTKEQLKDAPKFAFYQATKSQTTGSAAPDKLNGMSPKDKLKK